MKTQHPAFWPVWVRNFKGAFHYGYKFIEKGGFKGNVLPFLHTFALPFTLTFGVTIKTIVDVRSRKLLGDTQLDALKAAINAMEDNPFNAKIALLYGNSAKSNSSRLLISHLWKAQQHEKEHFSQLIANKKGAIKRKREIEEYRRRNREGENLDRYPLVSLSQAEANAIIQKHQPDSAQFYKNRIEEQKTLLLSFLNDSHNAGKKTEHVLYKLFCPQA